MSEHRNWTGDVGFFATVNKWGRSIEPKLCSLADGSACEFLDLEFHQCKVSYYKTNKEPKCVQTLQVFFMMPGNTVFTRFPRAASRCIIWLNLLIFALLLHSRWTWWDSNKQVRNWFWLTAGWVPTADAKTVEFISTHLFIFVLKCIFISLYVIK